MKYSLEDVFKNIKENKIEKSEALSMIKKLHSDSVDDIIDSTISNKTAEYGTLMFLPSWKEQAVIKESYTGYDKHVVILIEGSSVYKSDFNALYPKIECTVLNALDIDKLEERFEQYCCQILECLQHLFKIQSQNKMLLQILVQDEFDQRIFAGLIGLLRTSRLENTGVITQLIIANEKQNIASVVECGYQPENVYIKLKQDKSYVATWKEKESTIKPSIPWKDAGVYLITGGLGGLGILFAKEIASKTKNANLILCGRSPISQHKLDLCKKIEALGAKVQYIPVDISNAEEVNKMFHNIDELSGIIHSAGVIKDDYIFRKNSHDVNHVFAPKVSGLVNLDKGSKHFSLDFFALFSSGSGCTGNQGQSDYAAANTFMDSYAEYRNEQVRRNLCKGSTLSINWPLWKDGGMNVDKKTLLHLLNVRGMKPMQTIAGFNAFYNALEFQESQVMVIEGHIPTIRNFFFGDKKLTESKLSESQKTNLPGQLYDRALLKLKELLAEVTKQPIEKLDAFKSIANYGIESFMISRLNQKLALPFKELSKTLFYEYSTLSSIVTYLIEAFEEECINWLGTEYIHKIAESKDSTPVNKQSRDYSVVNNDVIKQKAEKREPIAIIGVSGRYPQAENLNEFWGNLKSGKDCITEIPEDRWSIDNFYSSERTVADAQGKSYSKWGGFINDASYFDPLFFSISPREAVNMDPQERLFLESSWEVLEDAGYSRKKLLEIHNNRVGVFAGVTKTGYALHGQKSSASRFNPLTSFSSIANRVSYTMDFNGPSIPIDTMCSSSLTAIHEACEHIYQDTCEMAIAGGVNLYLHPSNYTDLCKYKMLSDDGKCRSFGKGGSGFVPGEGVGCVLLKPLSAAIRDKDNIYALVKGTNINHGGKTSGYTVPNPKAQALLIQGALNKANISARTISYLEAHGTGTELGDPIEIKGLTQAYAQDTSDMNYCSIGSAKSNIGHLEAAAGIAGITKIILQLKHKQLAPSLHTEELNPNINFNKTPFVVQKELDEWKQPTIVVDGENVVFPRIAGISSFGAGGANAHVIIEEYNAEVINSTPQVNPPTSILIPISAKSEESLKGYAQKLLRYIENINTNFYEGNEEKDLPSIEEKITNLLATIYQVNSEDLDSNELFEEYGIENFHQMVLKEEVEKIYDIDIVTKDFLELQSIASIASYLLNYKRLGSSARTQGVVDLYNMAYTLQVGREAMEERAVFIVETLQELEEKLKGFINNQEHQDNFYRGRINRSKEELNRITSDENWLQIIQDCFLTKKLSRIASFWINGIDLDWERLYDKDRPKVISLPTYAFSKKKYWIPNTNIETSELTEYKVFENSALEPSGEEANFQKPTSNQQIKNNKKEQSVKISKEEIQNYVKELVIQNIKKALDLETHEIDYNKSFADYGLDSILGVDLIDCINSALDINLETIKLFDYSSVNKLTDYILLTYIDDVSRVLTKNKKRETMVNNISDNSTNDNFESQIFIENNGNNLDITNNGLATFSKELANNLQIKNKELEKPLIRSKNVVKKHVIQIIVENLSDALGLDIEEIDYDRSFADYGLDSILGVDFIDCINSALAINLETIKLFDYSSVNSLTGYILTTYIESISSLVANKKERKISKREYPIDSNVDKQVFPKNAVKKNDKNNLKEPIAIIGISGRFSNSENLDELWGHLANGDDLIEKVSRWDLDGVYNSNGKTRDEYCDSGSFVSDIDKFDPLFFNISGVEANHMDPQQRIFLEESWKALEDAGYAGDDVKGTNCGVYVGCCGGDYQSHFSENTPAQALWGTMGSVIPSRIAYYLDFKGPAISVDTSCSSSLVSIEMACKDLWVGETEMALAGGVFIQTTPRLYTFAEGAGMLSTDGRCKTFDQSANGFVPGEGAGVIVLKRLSDAVEAGDHVYGVIKGIGINQDGTTNGITAPSANSQENLLTRIYEEFDVNPEDIQMVEAHGTGTKLGDPIEFSALTKAFRKFTDKQQYSALGSIKTNIGHSQFAAGIAGVLKIILSLKHELIPASLHYKEGNNAIQFDTSPFFVNTKPKPWKRGDFALRTATVSSFGASGTNAHLVISEAPNNTRRHEEKAAYIIPFSARSKTQLVQQVDNLLSYCDTSPSIDLGNISYTLCTGRKHMNYRLACAVSSVQELCNALRQWKQTGNSIQVFDSNSVTANSHEHNTVIIEECNLSITPKKYLENIKCLASIFVEGKEVLFKKLFDNTYGRIPLPAYPFSKERYWVEGTQESKKMTMNFAKTLHPLVHENTSDSNANSYRSVFTGQEFFLKDHHVKGKKVLPGVAYLEIARVAAELSLEHPLADGVKIALNDVVWISPVEVEQTTEVQVSFSTNEGGNMNYNIQSRIQNTADWELNSQGSIAFVQEEPQVLDVSAWQDYCNETTVLPERCYDAIKKMGIVHGPSLQSVVSIAVGNGYVLSKLVLPISAGELSDFVLHPSMLDAAIQASIGLFIDEHEKTALPFGIESTVVIQECAPIMWALISFNPEHTSEGKIQKLDIDLYDEKSNLCVQMKGYTSRVLEAVPIEKIEDNIKDSIQPEGEIVSVLLHPIYDSVTPKMTALIPTVNNNILILGGDSKQQSELRELYPLASIFNYSKNDTISTLAEKLENHKKIDHIIWIAEEETNELQNEDVFIEKQETGVFLGFRLIKALLQLDYDAHNLEYTVITVQSQAINNEDTINPIQASIHGLIGAMAKEYPNWNVRLVDMPAYEMWSLDEVLKLPFEPRGHAIIKRNKVWHHQRLLPLIDETPITISYKQEGVYVIIGGAGGIGKVWTEYMIKTYNAKVIWIGRREKDHNIQAQLDEFIPLGGLRPEYISADATDRISLENAYQQIKQNYGIINGLIHSALVLRDQGLAGMNEENFRASLEVKVNTSVRIAQVFDKENLDFVLFFSSIQSFAKVQGQSNYAAGCIFKDAFAHNLRKKWSCDVKVMNWGYWGGVGVGATKSYRQRMANFGLASIEMPEAMTALERLLNSTTNQLALSKGSKAMQVENIYLQEHLQAYPEQVNTCIKNIGLNPQIMDSRTQNIKNQIGSQLNEMDAYLVKLLWGQLQAIGMFNERKTPIAKIKAKLGMTNEYDRWLDESLEVLERNNYLTLDDAHCTVLDTDTIDMDAIWHAWDLEKEPWIKDPNRRAKVMLIEATMRALPDILLAEKQATDIIFPRSSMKLVEGVYKNNAISDYFNEVLSDVLINYVKERVTQNPNTKIRILEIGAGTGGTSALIFPKLRPYQSSIAEYCYTDLSKAFLSHAKREYGPQNPYLSYKILNVEKPISDQDIDPDTFDVVIATNVLHATKNIRNTLRNTKATMKTNGILLLNEINGNSLFNHLTFGLLKGWWLYDDATIRIPGSPGLSPESWKQILENEGYRSVLFPAEGARDLGQAVIVAESNGIARVQKPYEFSVKETTLYNTITPILVDNPKKLIAKTVDTVIKKTAVVVPERTPETQVEQTDVSTAKIKKLTTAYIKEIIAETLKISPQQMQAKEPLESYGLDSILVVQVTNALRKVFSNVKSTLLFEFQTVNDLSDHFIKTQKEVLLKVLELDTQDQQPVLEKQTPIDHQQEEPSKLITPITKESKINHVILPPSSKKEPVFKITADLEKEDIAIIGLSGTYPQAADVNEYWENLKSGKNCIREVPSDRWDWKAYYDSEKGKEGSIYSKWGGFIDDIDKFDPLFFRISPAEAEKMDPQERLFLQTAYASIQDAGYTPENISESRKVGVFAGAMNANYPIGAAYFSIANRVSYALNFQGPSLAVDTACSSSLTAIHLAMESLYSGSCECAIAGGVNLIVDPYHYQKLCDLTMLSSDDQCKSFGANADGFVDGEGVGAILLKPLSKAKADGDHIYGVLKGSAINAGGKTNGYMVPNPVAQAQLITDAYKKANIDLRKVSYIEAHGTGTSLGDPIEVLGLTRAFEEFTSDRGFCALGSVKSNIGHAESAAGIAGLTKVLMQMKHGQLAPSLHSDVHNPNIDFNETPFILQKGLTEWERPEIIDEDQSISYSRIAGISSFGAGGANAHLIVEEYIPENTLTTNKRPDKDVMIILSAKDENRLHELVQKMTTTIQNGAWSNYDLDDIAYTLQVGRESMETRLAFIVDSIKELQEKLEAFIQGNKDLDNMYQGQVKRSNETIDFMFDDDDDIEGTIADWITKEKYNKILSLWVKGLEVNWSKLNQNHKGSRVSLPTYSFAKEHYWMERSETSENDVSDPIKSTYKYDKFFYEELFDGVVDDTLSIELAIEKLEDFYNN